MKIWISLSSEHSAKLVIIGTFQTSSDAQAVVDLFERTASRAQEDVDRGILSFDKPATQYSKEMLDFLMNNNLATFGYNDPLQLLWDYRVKQSGNRVVVTTDEMEVQALIKLMLSRGAAIEMFSTHDHPERGRSI